MRPGKVLPLLLLLISGGGLWTPAFAVIAPAPFDWSMPSRLLEHSANPGIPQYDPDARMIPPDGWRVDFDACAGLPHRISKSHRQ